MRVQVATGVSLHVERGGAGPETVVLVNGLTMTTAGWEPVAARLANRYDTVRYDCRGQGRSAAPAGPYRPEQHAQDLLALLDALGVRRAHLVGLSNGGLVSLLAAASAPERVASLGMVCSFARVDEQLRAVLRSWLAALEAGGPELRFDVATPWVWGHEFQAERAAELWELRTLAGTADPAAVDGLIRGLFGFTTALPALCDYLGPLLVVSAEDDLLTPPRYGREIIDAAGHGRFELVPGAGHALPLERPDVTARVLSEFLKEVPGC